MRGRGEKTRRRLLDAGAAVFAKRGFHAARVDDIVKGARTSHGTFYLYFENKEDLFAALVGEVTTHMEALLDDFPAFGPDPSGQTELRVWLERFADHYRESGPVLRAWTEAEIAGDSVGAIGAAASARFAEAVTARFRTASSPVADPDAAALAIVAMIERAQYYMLTKQLDVDPAQMAATLARVTHAAVHG